MLRYALSPVGTPATGGLRSFRRNPCAWLPCPFLLSFMHSSRERASKSKRGRNNGRFSVFPEVLSRGECGPLHKIFQLVSVYKILSNATPGALLLALANQWAEPYRHLRAGTDGRTQYTEYKTRHHLVHRIPSCCMAAVFSSMATEHDLQALLLLKHMRCQSLLFDGIPTNKILCDRSLDTVISSAGSPRESLVRF